MGNALTAQHTGKDGGGCFPRPLDSPNPVNNKEMTQEQKQIADMITANIISCTKEVLTSEEAAAYMGISKSYLYKLTMRREIPHYKPTGKIVYFNRLELEEWLQRNKVRTDEELNQQAAAYIARKG